MMRTAQNIDRLADGYRGEGYDVIVRPESGQLPAFAADFRVEIVGRRGAEGVLVAARKNRAAVAADGDLPSYAEVTGGQPGWRFDLAVLEGENSDAFEFGDAEELTESEIARSLDRARELDGLGYPQAAVVAAWAAFEAAMRMRLRATGERAGRVGSPRQIWRELYSAGELTPEEFRVGEGAAKLRNRIAHGFAPGADAAGPSESAVVRLLGDVSTRLMEESRPAGVSAAARDC